MRAVYDRGAGGIIGWAVTQRPGQADPLLLQHSLVFREWLAEHEEIERHKWLESEKRGYDIGYECAVTSWVVHHRCKWLAGRRLQRRT